MRQWLAVIIFSGTILAQDPYAELAAGRFESAVTLFRQKIDAGQKTPALYKDLGYTLLRIGETEAGRDAFAAAMKLAPDDTRAALEYAFLCHETKRTRDARRTFDRLRQSAPGDTRDLAERAFQNIDRALASNIDRWGKAAAQTPDSDSVHEELARNAEDRDELKLAEEHYARAWALKPARRSLLADLGRVRKYQGRDEDALITLLAASRSAEPRVAEAARELLPDRYPFVYEFRQAIAMDPRNFQLRRELGFLLVQIERKEEAEKVFAELLGMSPDDLLAATQLGFLRLARNDVSAAMPLLQKVLESGNEELANRVRIALKMPVPERPRPVPVARDTDVRTLAERSFQAGFMRDALRYFQQANETSPADTQIMLRLGWTHNMLHDDREAIRWFRAARASTDPKVASEATKAWRNLRPDFAPVRTTLWMTPSFSTRWHSAFAYGQAKAEFRIGRLPVRPYLSARFVGDAGRGYIDARALSERAIIPAIGIGTKYWKGLMGWAEAGVAMPYRSQPGSATRGDYRGGVTFGKGFGRMMGGESSGWFATANYDAVYISRFRHDVLGYMQHRAGYTLNRELILQAYFNMNVTVDRQREYWGNFWETGPGSRLRWRRMPPGLMFTADLVRGRHLVQQGNPRGPTFYDVRLGIWYAVTF